MDTLEGLDPKTQAWVTEQQGKAADKERKRNERDARDNAEGSLYATTIGRWRSRLVVGAVATGISLGAIGALWVGSKVVKNPFGEDAPTLDDVRAGAGNALDGARNTVGDAISGDGSNEGSSEQQATTAEGYSYSPELGDRSYMIGLAVCGLETDPAVHTVHEDGPYVWQMVKAENPDLSREASLDVSYTYVEGVLNPGINVDRVSPGTDLLIPTDC